MITLKNITKSFDGKQVLKGISSTFQAGLCNLIIGASGTGKSVLLKNIVGLLTPDSGEVLFDGRDFWQASRKEKQDIRREIGMLFQGSALFDSKTVEENVRFPLDNMQDILNETEKADRVNFCLKRVGLENANKKMPSEISGGMKKRVGIARAIVMQTKYLFCDEPNSGLDPLTSIKIDKLIQEITYEYKITTVVVTHDMNSVLEIGDYIMFMANGDKIWEGNKENILSTNVTLLNDFVFSNQLLKTLRKT